jgi:hypothetical protein
MRKKGNIKTTNTHMIFCMIGHKHLSDYNFNICSYKELNFKENTRSWNFKEGAIDGILFAASLWKGQMDLSQDK